MSSSISLGSRRGSFSSFPSVGTNNNNGSVRTYFASLDDDDESDDLAGISSMPEVDLSLYDDDDEEEDSVRIDLDRDDYIESKSRKERIISTPSSQFSEILKSKVRGRSNSTPTKLRSVSSVSSLKKVDDRRLKRVRVAIRCRPLLGGNKGEEEAAAGNSVQLELDHPHNRLESLFKGKVTVSLDKRNDTLKSFRYDHVFGPDATQSEVYSMIAKPIVRDVLQGYNGAIMAYGQTGTGKTYTMGILDRLGGGEVQYGIIPGSIKQIFDDIQMVRCGPDCKCVSTVKMSFLQIYLESMQDLLAPFDGGKVEDNLPLREDPRKGFYVQGLRTFPVNSFSEAMSLINFGLENRNMACTTMNASSSRSHTVLTLHIEKVLCSNRGKLNCKLRLIDLAGSERVRSNGKAANESARIDEARSINGSLSALGNVVAALAQRDSMSNNGSGARSSFSSASSLASFSTDVSSSSGNHVPFRDSKLTKLLQDTLGGKAGANTALIATIGPCQAYARETLSTLKFASRCMRVKSEARIRKETTNYSGLCSELQQKMVLMEQEFASRESQIRKTYEREILSLKRYLSNQGVQSFSSTGSEIIFEMYSNFMNFAREYKERLNHQKTMLLHLLESEFPTNYRFGDLKEEVENYIAETPVHIVQNNISNALDMHPNSIKKEFLTIKSLPVNTHQNDLNLHCKIIMELLRMEADQAHALLNKLLSEVVKLHEHGVKREEDLENCSHVLQYLIKTNDRLRQDMVNNNHHAKINNKNEILHTPAGPPPPISNRKNQNINIGQTQLDLFLQKK